MEEMMMAIMIRSPPVNPRYDQSISDNHITTSTCPTWKLYENPFYYSQSESQSQSQSQSQPRQQREEEHNNHKQLHRLHLPISTRKISASFFDLTFIRPLMESEIDIARAQIIELKAELEFERKARKKLESTNKKLTREITEERRGREALERVCEELAKEVSSDKAEINAMKREMEEERKMLRMAEVLREERVQMKLADAKFLLEEKLLELEFTKQMQIESTTSKTQAEAAAAAAKPTVNASNIAAADTFSVQSITRCVLGERSACNTSTDNNGVVNSISSQRRASPEPENPHIKRGIKGFVEFPRVVRAIGSKRKHLGTKLECQKAQLRILLKQKSPIRSNSLIMS